MASHDAECTRLLVDAWDELERLRAGLARVVAVCDAADEQHDYVTADVDTDVIRLAILDRHDEAPTRVLRDEVATFLSVVR